MGNPSIQVEETDSSDTLKVVGRGELQLAILIETMRREGYEISISKPTVRTRREKGKLFEPFEHLIIDCPEIYIGVVTQAMGLRRGKMSKMINHSEGWVRLEFETPMRGLIGLRSYLNIETRGSAVLNHMFLGWFQHVGEIPHRTSGVLIADRQGRSNAYSIENLQERGQMFIAPGDEVYAGYICGENSRTNDIWVNPTKEKKLTNMRASSSEESYHLHPPRILSLEEALEFIADDELVEVTPKSIRLRKRHRDQLSAWNAKKAEK
jgi:GTP-binding protein